MRSISFYLRCALLAVMAFVFFACDGGDKESIVYEIEGVSIDVSEAELVPSETLKLTAVLLPYNKPVDEVEWADSELREQIFWKTDNSKVAVVEDNGLVRAVGTGSCNISFICGAYSAKCRVTVRSFKKDILYGFWEIENTTDSLFLGFDGKGYRNDSVFDWTFDGMRVAMSFADTTNVLIVTSVNAGKIQFRYKDSDASAVRSLKRAPLIITHDDLARNIIAKQVEGGSTVNVVDLNLPSGMLWASCNLDATAPEEDGQRYAWAETTIKRSYTLSNYSWYDYSRGELTKYSDDSMLSLQADDDPVRVKLGESWSTPSVDDVKELFENCNILYCTLSGKKGFLFQPKTETAFTGCLFIPFSLSSNLLSVHGSGQGESPYEKYGFFWTSTLSSVDPYEAHTFCINLDDNMVELYSGVGKSKRYYGLCIRPVFMQKK